MTIINEFFFSLYLVIYDHLNLTALDKRMNGWEKS
jgi:hypothetical protein